MQSLIKKIRLYVGLSQQELGEKLGVTFATINRWENGKAAPNKLAQTKLYEFCKENNVPVYEMTLQRIQNEADSLEIEEGRILLYHGSKSGVRGQIAPISREKCDFGAGFYMGTEPEQPLTLTCDFEKAQFYIVSIALEGLKTLEVPADMDVMQFESKRRFRFHIWREDSCRMLVKRTAQEALKQQMISARITGVKESFSMRL